MDCRTIRVCGLPVDIPQNRLSDKLKIHFLRKKNGGGEISSVTVLQTTPASALITFDECEVAQRVVHHGIQTLSLNEKEYRVTVSLQEEEIDPHELFIDLAVTVDHNKLPGGKTALSGILMNFQDIKVDFHPKDDLCTLSGRYSRVQTLTKSLLSLINSKKQNTSDFQFPKSEVISDQSKYHSTKGQLENKRETELSEQACGINLSKYSSRRSDRSHTPQRASNTNHSEVSKDPEVGTSLEDFSMILDTDIFRYLQHCSKEYKSILDRHGVEVLDVTTKDITTLYLQSQAGIEGKSLECIQRAHVELGCLYQKKEAQLRKVSLPKEGLHSQGLQQAIEVVIQTFPKLLINEDKANVYLVGSGTDVSEAKQFLMDMEVTANEHGGDKIKPSDAFFQPSGSASPPFMPETHVNKCLRQGRDEKTKMYKMDHNFGRVLSVDESKDNTFFSTSVEVTAEDDQTYLLLATKSNPNYQHSDSGPVSETMSLKLQPSSSSCGAEDFNFLTRTGEDTPFKSTAPMNRLPSLSSALRHSNRTKKEANSSESQNHSLDYVALSIDKAATTDSINQSKKGSSMRKTNSVSETVGSKQVSKTNDSDGDFKGQTQSSKFSSLKFDDGSETAVLSVEMEVSSTKWLYMKAFYHTEIEDLTSDLQLKEKDVGRKGTVIILTGADAADVEKTRWGLRELISKVPKDFCTKELRRELIGVSHSKTVETLCEIVTKKFDKVLILPMPQSIFIFGPKPDCLDAMSALKELFHVRSKEQKQTEERSFEVKVHSATLNYDQNPAATNFTIDDKDKVDQAISVTNSSSSKNSEQMPSDYSHQVNSKQGNEEPKIKFRGDVDYLKNDYSNQAKKRHDIKQSFEKEDISKSPAQLATTEPSDQNNFSTNTQRESCLEGNGRDITPLSYSSTQLLTGSKSSQTMNPNTQLSQTLDAASQTTITQNVSCEENQNENRTKTIATGTVEAGTSKDNAVNVNLCLWCHGKVNPHCGMCRKSDAMNLPSSNDRPSGSNQYGDKPVEHTVEKHGQVCGCGIRGESVTLMACGVNLCPECKEKLHSKCRVCPKSEEIVSGIRGTMTWKEMSLSLDGHSKDTTMKITYNIPDGIQGTDHPHPGAPFKGGTFSAFLPMNETTRKLLPSLEEAFNRGNIFHVKEKDNKDMVTWGNNIPHKTNINGGRSKNGFPDSSYLRCLSNALKSQGIKDS